MTLACVHVYVCAYVFVERSSTYLFTPETAVTAKAKLTRSQEPGESSRPSTWAQRSKHLRHPLLSQATADNIQNFSMKSMAKKKPQEI